MNEKLEYANMLEIPVNTCSVTVKQKKKSLFRKRNVKKIEDVKTELVNRVNSDVGAEETEELMEEGQKIKTEGGKKVKIGERIKDSLKLKKLSATFAIGIVGVILAVVFLANAFYPKSGLRVFLSSVFDNGEQVVDANDDRTFKDFSPVFGSSLQEQVVVSDGIITFKGEGSVYSTVDGIIKTISVDGNGKYAVEIAHSDNFTSVISNLDFVYGEQGEEVFANIPVGYVIEELRMQFLDAEANVITDYEIIDGTVVWGV